MHGGGYILDAGFLAVFNNDEKEEELVVGGFSLRCDFGRWRSMAGLARYECAKPVPKKPPDRGKLRCK